MNLPPIIEVNLRSLKDQTLTTSVGKYHLIRGEIFKGQFRNNRELNNLIQIGVIEEAPADLLPEKDIPIILLDEDGEEISLSGNLEKILKDGNS